MKRKGVDYLAFGIDSSNHGRDPEFYVAVASTNPADVEIISNHPKIKDPVQIAAFLAERDYKYTIIREEDYERLGSKVIVRATVDLVCAFPYSPEALEIYVDGALMVRDRNHIKFLISECIGTHSQHVQVKEVPKQKQNTTNLLISLADGKASNLFRGKGSAPLERRITIARKF